MLKNSAPKAARLRLQVGMMSFGLLCCIGLARDASARPTVLQAAQPSARVMDLATAWRRALEHDYRYQAAISERAAAQTERSQGRAGLLPQVQAGYVRSKVSGSARQPAPLGQPGGFDLDYDSSNAYVQLQQPLLNYGRYADYRRGAARADQGNAVFAVKQQEAGIRLAAAYFNVLLAYDHLALQRALASSLQERATAFEARYHRNEGTRTEAQETQARLAIARADVIKVIDDLTVALRELRALLGVAPTRMAALKDDFPLLPLTPVSMAEWLDRARAGSAQVLSARQALIVANTEVDRAASEYLPSVDLVATYSKADSENLSMLSQRSNTFVIGIQVSIPLFSGGYTRANVARARLDRNRLQYTFKAMLEQNQAEVTRQYSMVQAGMQRIKALQAAVASAQASLEAVRMGFSLGTVGNLEVLKVQDTLYQARYELIKARLEHLLARLKLAAAAGALDSSHFDAINDAYLGRVIAVAGGAFDGRVVASTASLRHTKTLGR